MRPESRRDDTSEFQIWVIHTVRGPLEALAPVEGRSLGRTIKDAKHALKHNPWFGVGVKLIGETAWSWVTYRDEPLLELHSQPASQPASQPILSGAVANAGKPRMRRERIAR